MSKYQSFNVGDVVEYVGEKDRCWKIGEQHVIQTAEFQGGRVEYSTNHGAWFDNSDFKLVRKADRKSFSILNKCEDEG